MACLVLVFLLFWLLVFLLVIKEVFPLYIFLVLSQTQDNLQHKGQLLVSLHTQVVFHVEHAD
jgi:hypothetical protein